MNDSFKLTLTFHAFEWIFLCYTVGSVSKSVGNLFLDYISRTE